MRELWASTSQHVAQLPSRSAGLRPFPVLCGEVRGLEGVGKYHERAAGLPQSGTGPALLVATLKTRWANFIRSSLLRHPRSKLPRVVIYAIGATFQSTHASRLWPVAARALVGLQDFLA